MSFSYPFECPHCGCDLDAVVEPAERLVDVQDYCDECSKPLNHDFKLAIYSRAMESAIAAWTDWAHERSKGL